MIPHALFETLSYTVGFAVYRFLRSRAGDVIPDSTRWSVIAAAAAGAAVGSKVLFWFEEPVATLALWRNAVYLMGGKTIVGGLIGGLIDTLNHDPCNLPTTPDRAPSGVCRAG